MLDITVHDADTLRFVLDDDPVEVVAAGAERRHGAGGAGGRRNGRDAVPLGPDRAVPRRLHDEHAGTGFEVHGTEGSLIGRDCMTQKAVGDVMLRAADGEKMLPIDRTQPLCARPSALSRGHRGRRASRPRPARTASGRSPPALAVREVGAHRRRGRDRDGTLRSSDGIPRSSSADEAAALIPDGAVVTVSSSSGLGCPDAVLEAIGERFDATGHPRGLTTLHPDRGRRHVRHQGHRSSRARRACLAAHLAGSYPSGPSSSEPPLIWQMIGGNEIPAYNIPSGILFDMHREAAAKRPGVLTKVGLDTFVDPGRRGLRDERARRGASRW